MILSSGKPVIIAEIGLSHEGSLGQAKAFALASAQSGADIVKFQYHIPRAESSKEEKFRVDLGIQFKTRSQYWERTSFNLGEWHDLIQYCKEIGIKFACSVFSLEAARNLIDLNVSILKLGSGDLANEEFQESLQEFTGDLVISTGMATITEIDQAINAYTILRSTGRLTLLQCTSLYPTPRKLVGLNVLKEFKNRYGVPVGLSDHSEGITASQAALVLGAEVIEKHVIFSRKMFGPDVSSSITFEELEKLVTFRDELSELQTYVDKDEIAKTLDPQKKLFSRSLGLIKELPVGSIISQELFCLRKPAGGLSWSDRTRFIGKKLSKPYKVDELLDESYFS
jgi:N,N'-diacetyllegionaminate synthase